MKGTVVVAGSLAQKPRRGGHTWVVLQYLLGFRRLGWHVLFLDRLEREMCVDARGRSCRVEASVNLSYFLDVMRGAGFEGLFSLDYNKGERRFGLGRVEVLERIRTADCLLNIMGFLDDDEMLGAVTTSVFLDIDPGFSHMWQALGLADLFSGYDKHVSVAQNLGHEGCLIPTCDLNWITTAPPVVLGQWRPQRGIGTGHFTTVGAWRGAYGPVQYDEQTFGLRVHEFRKFVALPRRTGQAFSIALDIHEEDGTDQNLLTDNGWVLENPVEAAGDPWSYQRYIQQSKAEIMIAKNMYVGTNSGWFSDRSTCYLASGRPVLAQDTGCREHYPHDEGLVTFQSLDEAISGVESISSAFERHSTRARDIAEEYFDSDRVLSTLMYTLGC